MTGMTLDQFLGHKTRDKNDDRAARLSNWRKDENAKRNQLGDRECSVLVWLHTQATFQARWIHQWPGIVELKKTNTRAVWSRDFVCLEDEATLRSQYKRRDGERVNPPKICPHCLLTEAVRKGVVKGDFKWTDPLFVFETEDDKKVLHAGGIYGAFKSQKLTDVEKAEMAAAKISPKDAWKEIAMAKCTYVCRVVENDHPEKGIQVAVEIDSIGDAMKRKLFEEIQGRGDQGNPMINPYALKWSYYPDEADFRKRYSVIPMPIVKLSDDVRELICNTPPPSVDYLMKPANMKVLRASMEEYCVTDKLDWDAIFGPVEKFCDENGVYHDPNASQSTETDETPSDEDNDSDQLPF